MLKNAYGFIYITTNDINGKKYMIKLAKQTKVKAILTQKNRRN